MISERNELLESFCTWRWTKPIKTEETVAQFSINIKVFKSIITCNLENFNFTSFTQKLSNVSEYDDIARNTFVSISGYQALFAPAIDLIQSIGMIENDYQGSLHYYINTPRRTEYNTVNGLLVSRITQGVLKEKLKICSFIPLVFDRTKGDTSVGWVRKCF